MKNREIVEQLTTEQKLTLAASVKALAEGDFSAVGIPAFRYSGPHRMNARCGNVLPSFAAQVAVYLLFGCVVFALLLLLNLYICPYRVRVGDVVWGSLLTLLLGGAASFGFSIYVRFSSIGKLYGAAVFLILFLLWLYILMTCFVIGAIFNCYLLEKDKKQKIVHKKF